MTIYLNPPPTPDAKWRENVKRDADKLGAELRSSRRRFLFGAGAGAIVAAVNEYINLRKTYAMFVRGGGTTASTPSVTKITNLRTGTTYQYLPDAIYNAATADTILVPAGTAAPDYPSTPYSNWQQLDSGVRGFTSGTGFDSMYIGVGDAGRYTAADYLTIKGDGTANNGRASLTRPHSTLASDFHSGDTTMHLVDASQFPPTPSSGTGASQFNFIWGDGSADSETYGTLSFSYTSISGNDLIGVSAGSYTTTIPAGQMVMNGVVNAQSIFTSFAAPGHSNTFIDLEMWGATTYPAYAGTAVSVRSGFSGAGGSSVGSLTFNNCFVHDCNTGVGLGDPCLGNTVFAHIFNSELWRNGYQTAHSGVHNAYFSWLEEVIFDGSYSHETHGTHLFKSRARSTYVTYSRISGERTDINTGSVESCNLDISNGGLTFIIGNAFEQSLNAANNLLNFNAEGNYAPNCESGGQNPTQELYFINNTCVGPTNGTGKSGFVSYAPVQIQAPQLGVIKPEQSKLSSSTAGALAQRTYVVQTTMSSGGFESAASVLLAQNGEIASQVFNALTVPVNKILGVLSPVTRTGASLYNVYANYLDPLVYRNQLDGTWWWDSALTTSPVFSQSTSGSLPLTRLYFGFTYQFATGESSLIGVLGMDTSFGFVPGPHRDGDYSNNTSSMYFAADYEVSANKVVTVASPPSMTGATGWNIYATVLYFQPGPNYTNGNASGYGLNGYSSVSGLSKQNSSPIAIGTPWVEPTTGVRTSEQTVTNKLRQNSSPITVGTSWTEPTSGLANNNPTGKLTWYRRGALNDNGIQINEWYAIAPTNLTSYVARVYFQQHDVTPFVSVTPITGAATPYPFSASLNSPVWAGSGALPKTLTFSEGHGVVVALFGSGTGTQTPGSGFTQIYSHYPGMAEYQIFSSAQTNLPITESGGSGGDILFADAIVGSGALTVGTIVTATDTNVNFIDITFSCSSGDVLLLHCSGTGGCIIYAIDSVVPPYYTDISAGSPICVVKNNMTANYNLAINGVAMVYPTIVAVPSGYMTQSNNYVFNTYNGATFDAPLWSTVINDATQANYDYRLKAASGAIGYGADPGAGPPDLRPHYELKLFGSPTPGTPIPAKTARPNTAGVYDAGAFEFGV